MNLLILGNKIKAERKQQNITLEKLAEQVSISRNFLWEIEAGRKAPALKTLYNLSIALNLSIDYLMGTSDKSKYISDRAMPKEYEEQISTVLSILNAYSIKEIQLVTKVLKEFTKYMADEE